MRAVGSVFVEELFVPAGDKEVGKAHLPSILKRSPHNAHQNRTTDRRGAEYG